MITSLANFNSSTLTHPTKGTKLLWLFDFSIKLCESIALFTNLQTKRDERTFMEVDPKDLNPPRP